MNRRGELQAAPPAIPATASPPTDATPRTTEALNTLLGPIAPYPDALITLFLPALYQAFRCRLG